MPVRPHVAGLAAVQAAPAALEAVGLELLERDPQRRRLVLGRHVLLQAVRAVLAHQPLRQDADEGAR